ncbi:MAG: hypothetical protein WDM89_16810 [Rhizomicrobium sp.]
MRLRAGQALVAHFGGRLTLVQGEFSHMDEIAGELVDGAVLDLGVSSFSSMKPSAVSPSAPTVRWTCACRRMAKAPRFYQQRPMRKPSSHVISRYAKNIVPALSRARFLKARPIARTGELAAVVSEAWARRRSVTRSIPQRARFKRFASM